MGSDERLTYGTQYGVPTSKVRVGATAERQSGLVTRAQLRGLGIQRSTIDRWILTGYLIRVLPRVFAVGHVATDDRTRLFSVALFAGPGAGLSHGTAAHHRDWLRYPVKAIHVSSPRRIRTRVPGVVFHYRPGIERELVNGIPCTTITQTLLDLAATEPRKLLFRALAQLDYERKLDPATIRNACGRGIPGSATLLKALTSYLPEMARTKSDLEDDFLLLCRRFGVPIPHVNVKLHGEEPDCYWPDYELVAELDGDGNHGTPAQRRRDHRKDMKLRAHGLTVVRYDFDQATYDAAAVAADVLAQIQRLQKPAA
jgi:hypothetical protein